MKGKEQPVLIIDKIRVNFVLYVSGLIAELRTQIRNFYRLARLILALVGDLVGLGLPDPRSRNIGAWKLYIEGLADRFDFSKRLDPVGFGELFTDWRRLLCPGGRRKEQ